MGGRNGKKEYMKYLEPNGTIRKVRRIQGYVAKLSLVYVVLHRGVVLHFLKVWRDPTCTRMRMVKRTSREM